MQKTNTSTTCTLPVSLEKHCISLSNRIWQLIPLREEKCTTLYDNIDRLNRELNGLMKIANNSDDRIITVMCLLENLKEEKNFKIYKADVFRCCDIIRKIAANGDQDV